MRPFPPATSRKACRSSRAEREILRAQSKKSISKASSSGNGSSFEGWLAANESVLATNVDTLCLILPREGKRIRVVCELSPTLTSDFSTRATMCRSQKFIFKKAGTLIVLMCTNYSIQVFKIRSVLCREQSGVYVAITMDQLLNNPPLGKGGYAMFHEPSLLLDLSKNC